MEARSLASLNLLAGNPPQYPANPSEEPQEPVTLYISRVPGTRDVILSPFKPQVKNVTGEDVASSLYYIHMEKRQLNSDLPNPQALRDDEFRSSSEDSAGAGARAIPRKPVTSLSRKPLPQNARPITPEEPPKPPSHLHVPRDGQTNPRQHSLSVGSYDAPPPPTPPKLMHDSGVGLPDPHPLPSEPYSSYAPDAYTARSQPPKVLGPRPMLGPQTAFAAPIPEKGLPELPPTLEPVDVRNTVRPSWGMGSGDGSSRSPSPRFYGGSSSPRTSPFTLTLIRRDPSSGNQWNVGRISSHEIEPSPTRYDENGARIPSSSSTARPPIDIKLETGGYAKFRNMPVGHGLDPGRGHALSGLPGRSAEDLTHVPRDEQGLFTRQVVMAYSKSWTSSLMDKMSKKTHSRHASKASVNSVSSAFSVGPDPAGHPEAGMKPRGYVFTSPWDGRCEFRTGNGGRSVRCHHILHEAASFNPLVADQEGHAAAKPASTTVSELRFNLPGSELFSSGDQERDTKSQWRGHFSKLMGTDDHDDDDVVSPFDVNVGAERAGGGNRGKRAKLGKLIIYNDGLKMLDLVVAANMGVWWGAWERSF